MNTHVLRRCLQQSCLIPALPRLAPVGMPALHSTSGWRNFYLPTGGGCHPACQCLGGLPRLGAVGGLGGWGWVPPLPLPFCPSQLPHWVDALTTFPWVPRRLQPTTRLGHCLGTPWVHCTWVPLPGCHWSAWVGGWVLSWVCTASLPWVPVPPCLPLGAMVWSASLLPTSPGRWVGGREYLGPLEGGIASPTCHWASVEPA